MEKKIEFLESLTGKVGNWYIPFTITLICSCVLVSNDVVSINYEYQLMQSYPASALDRRLEVDWARDAREAPRVLISLRVDFGPMG